MTIPRKARRSPCRLRVERLEERTVLSPSMLDPNLDVRPVVTGLTAPSALAFLGPNDMFVAERTTGQVRRVTGGVIGATVLDLNVNFGSERGLLGMTLHPQFPANPGVYLYWTASTIGADTNVLANTPLLGNRVDRFVWDGTRLRFDQNIIHIRALQQDANQQERGNHDGGVITFGHDWKLYVIIGDLGRRGLMQNNMIGPFPDDQFGGPEPDNAHLSGVVLRLNDNGTAPTDNPFYDFGASLGGEVGANLQKVFAYGVRNSFGLAVDPYSGLLWNQENGDDSFDEINRITSGQNNGWIDVMGPLARIAEFKAIENGTPIPAYRGLQQVRWDPALIPDTPAEVIDRLVWMPNSYYIDPQFSWKFAVPPAAIGFVFGRGLGAEYEGDLLAGAATPTTMGGYLFRFKLTLDRMELAFTDPRLADRVADNADKHDITESESLLIGRDFGITTDIETGPNGNVYVASLLDGTVYEIFRVPTGPGSGPGSAFASAVSALVSAQRPEADMVVDVAFAASARETTAPTPLVLLPTEAAPLPAVSGSGRLRQDLGGGLEAPLTAWNERASEPTLFDTFER